MNGVSSGWSGSSASRTRRELADHLIEAVIFHHDDENPVEVAAPAAIINSRERDAGAVSGAASPTPTRRTNFERISTRSSPSLIMQRSPPRGVMLVDREGELSVP